MRTITVLITICSLSFPSYAKYGGGTGEPNDPYKLATADDLLLLGDSPEDYGRHFILTADIDLDPNLPGRKVFDKAVIAPDDDQTKDWFQGTPFTGVFDGNGHTISHLTIEGKGYLGLLGQLESGAEVKDLGVVDVSITGSGYYVGGLVGWNRFAAVVTHCYSTGTVRGSEYVGGLVGYNEYGAVTHCYSTGAVSGTGEHGNVGGLVGDNHGQVTQCYSTGAVGGDSRVGGLVGYNYQGSVTHSFWDIQTSGQASSAGGTGKTAAQMQDIQTYLDAGWDFVGEDYNGTHEVWQMPEGGGYPLLAVLSGYVPPQLIGLGPIQV